MRVFKGVWAALTMLSNLNCSRIRNGWQTGDSNMLHSQFNFRKRVNIIFGVNQYSVRYSAAITLVSGDITDADLCWKYTYRYLFMRACADVNIYSLSFSDRNRYFTLIEFEFNPIIRMCTQEHFSNGVNCQLYFFPPLIDILTINANCLVGKPLAIFFI